MDRKRNSQIWGSFWSQSDGTWEFFGERERELNDGCVLSFWPQKSIERCHFQIFGSLGKEWVWVGKNENFSYRQIKFKCLLAIQEELSSMNLDI